MDFGFGFSVANRDDGRAQKTGGVEPLLAVVITIIFYCGSADLFVIPAQAGIQRLGSTGFPPARERRIRINLRFPVTVGPSNTCSASEKSNPCFFRLVFRLGSRHVNFMNCIIHTIMHIPRVSWFAGVPNVQGQGRCAALSRSVPCTAGFGPIFMCYGNAVIHTYEAPHPSAIANLRP